MVKFNLQKNFLLRKISTEAPNFQLATVVLSLELPVRGLVITIQYSNIVTLVTRSLDESLGQSLGKIVRKSMGSDPMRDSFLALRDSFRDSGRDWFAILFFSARVINNFTGKVTKHTTETTQTIIIIARATFKLRHVVRTRDSHATFVLECRFRFFKIDSDASFEGKNRYSL